MARKRTQRRSKARPGIPKVKHLLEWARRMSKALWADLRGSDESALGRDDDAADEQR